MLWQTVFKIIYNDACTDRFATMYYTQVIANLYGYAKKTKVWNILQNNLNVEHKFK